LRSSSAAPQLGQVRDGSAVGRGGAASGSSVEGRDRSSIPTIVLLRGSRRRRRRCSRRSVEPEDHAGGRPKRLDGCRVGRWRSGRRSRLLDGVVTLVRMASTAGCGQGEGGEQRRGDSISTHVDLRIAAHSTGKRQILSVAYRSDARGWRAEKRPIARTLGIPRFSRSRAAGTAFEKEKRQEGCRHGSSGTDGEGGIGRFPPLFFGRCQPSALQPSIEAGSRASRMSRTLRASVSGVNGFGRNEAPASSSTWLAIAASV